MALTISGTRISSDHTGHTAWLAAGPQPGWQVSWLPGRRMDRNTAITAMILAETASSPDLDERHRLWPAIGSWASELALTAPDAVRLASQPPGTITSREPKGSPPVGDPATWQARPAANPGPDKLAYSVAEAARLTGLSRDLLYDEMRRGNLPYIKVGRRRLITRQHLQHFLGLAS